MKDIGKLRQKKVCDMYYEILRKLFIADGYGAQRYIYNRKAEKAAAKRFKMKYENFVHQALNQMRENFTKAKLDARGRILNPKELGRHFNALLRIAYNNVDIYIIYSEHHLESFHLPISRSYRDAFREIIEKGEVVAILVVIHPPEETANEIHNVIEKKLHGIMTLWASKRFRQKKTEIREGLKNYLKHATVRVLTTGYGKEVDKIINNINEHLEEHGGFEDTHWVRVVKGVAQDEKKESLKQALGVCIPIVVIIKIVERVMPHIMHAVGGVLDDLFGAIIPDVSQSMGDKNLPRSERFKKAWPVLKGGLITLPVAFGLGWYSAVLYGSTESIVLRMLAGFMFALACCGGTLGTSIAAFKKSYNAIGNLQKDPEHAYLLDGYGTSDKIKLAFKESIMDVPFRVGHTVIGVPFQLALGVAAGAFGFFDSSVFIMIEGMAETILGSLTAFAYPMIARVKRNHRLRMTTLH